MWKNNLKDALEREFVRFKIAGRHKNHCRYEKNGKNLSRKPEGKRLFGILKRKYEDNIKVGITEVGYKL
jgi:hypothetical protein